MSLAQTVKILQFFKYLKVKYKKIIKKIFLEKLKKILHEFFLEKIYNYATITKKKKNMKYLQFDFLRLMNTKFHGNFHCVIIGFVRPSVGWSVSLSVHHTRVEIQYFDQNGTK